MKKILYSYITVPSEGSKVHIDSFVKAYRSIGGVVIENGKLVSPYKGGDKTNWPFSKKIKVRIRWFTDNLRQLVSSWGAAWKTKPDVLLFRFQPIHDFLLPIVVLSFFYPVVLEINAVRSIEHAADRHKLSDWFDRVSLSRAQRCLVVSEKLKQHLLEMYRIDEGRVAVIENGVDISEFHPGVSADYVRNSLKLEGRFVIGFVGSFRPWHGIEHLIALAEVLTIDLPQAIFLIVGDGPDRVLYEGQVQEKRLSEHFNFRGYVCHSQVPSYLASMDVVLAPHSLSSFKKGFYGSALKIFEYMAMGKPVIASPLGQIRDLIEDGVSGRLIHAEDSMRLKNAILDLYRDPSYRKRLGHNARVMVEKQFTWEVNAAKVERLCQEACNA